MPNANAGLALIEGGLFLLSDELGDVAQLQEHGLFASDTRFLSEYRLCVNGRSPTLLRSGLSDHRSAAIFTLAWVPRARPDDYLVVERRRTLNQGLHERIRVTNHSQRPLPVRLTLQLSADFTDLFQVRGSRWSRPRVATHLREPKELGFSGSSPKFTAETRVRFSEPAQLHRNTASFSRRLDPHESWELLVEVHVESEHQWPLPTSLTAAPAEPDRWLQHAPQLETNDPRLFLAYQRAVLDLAALAMPIRRNLVIPAAGVPWFVAIFGRDSLITAIQTQLLGSELSVGTLHALAAYQATERDDFRDAEPGKMPHEIRTGRLALLGRVPHARYYGTADATPLWIILLSETYRWTADLELVRRLLPHAEASLSWVDTFGDLDGDGFVEYRRRSRRGIKNQGWKDSWDAIRFADGRVARGPIAPIEVQGYVYDAKRRMAELYRLLGQPEKAEPLERQAAELRERVEEMFWMPSEGTYALALDGHKRMVDSVASNAGHLLWSGLPSAERARQVAERLLAEDMFSGWGIRTMSSRMGGYSPVSYHCGTVWPHDNSLIAQGMLRYGLREQAARVVRGLFEAAGYFDDYRLPELFCGYPREPGLFPITYPVACSPQAWAAGAVILLLQVALGIEGGRAEGSTPLPGLALMKLIPAKTETSPDSLRRGA